MGFKAKARKHRKDAGEEDTKTKTTKKEGEIPCGVKGCENFADKSRWTFPLGGRCHRHVGLERLRNAQGSRSSLQVLLPQVEEGNKNDDMY